MSARDSIWRLGDSQTVAYTDTAGTSAAVGAQTRAVSITVTSDAFIALGATATTDGHFLTAATSPLIVTCTGGQTVSAIQDSAGGNLHITELTH